MNITTNQILKAVANKNVTLIKGTCYWYFVYDSLDADLQSGIFETQSVMCKNLNHMSLEQWVDTGKQFVVDVESKYETI